MTLEPKALLGVEEERALGARVRTGTSDAQRAAQHELVVRNLRLVMSVALRYRGYGLEREDLIQEGALGLMRAAARFDPERGVRFATYATWCIRQAVIRALAEQGRLIRLPVYIVDTLRAVERAVHEAEAEGQPATVEHLADASGRSVAVVQRALAAPADAASLDASMGAGGRDDGGTYPVEREPHDDAPEAASQVVRGELRQRMRMLLARLDASERRVIEVRYGFWDGIAHTIDETIQTLAPLWGPEPLTRPRVRALEEQALQKLRHPHILHDLQGFIEAD